jgi:hypothetical protein
MHVVCRLVVINGDQRTLMNFASTAHPVDALLECLAERLQVVRETILRVSVKVGGVTVPLLNDPGSIDLLQNADVITIERQRDVVIVE